MEPISSNTTAPLASADSQTTSPLLGSSNRMHGGISFWNWRQNNGLSLSGFSSSGSALHSDWDARSSAIPPLSGGTGDSMAIPRSTWIISPLPISMIFYWKNGNP
ncbi:hypothetical protein PPTG_21051 [Phytophthora nicotianae INRA-310]|uniref:Uncharacterized protein n=1 Tax=Phytophthora nicotianae (strain INRA-310) TaxID=761204 RepID=W2R6S9_PHYN3|nr:hypothetical protein PPTG_21051 [Phytophthora nicotianae INRA-310]ETN21102.1 hypothetical protein PPTG_21051 [Phytophthora nicotianae INRA-310]